VPKSFIASELCYDAAEKGEEIYDKMACWCEMKDGLMKNEFGKVVSRMDESARAVDLQKENREEWEKPARPQSRGCGIGESVLEKLDHTAGRRRVAFVHEAESMGQDARRHAAGRRVALR